MTRWPSVTRGVPPLAHASATGSDPWSILGIKRGASADEIRAAFEAKEKELAPERLASKSREERKAAADELKRVTVAYQIIGP